MPPSSASSLHELPPRHPQKSPKLRVVAGGVALLLICLSFSALFHWAALEKLYLESSLSRFSVLGENLQKSLQISMQNGQSVHQFHGITDELERAERKIEGVLKGRIPGIRDVPATFSKPPVRVSVTLPDGSILYSSDKRLLNTAMPKAFWEDCCKSQGAGAKGAAFHYTTHQNRVVRCFQVLDSQKNDCDSRFQPRSGPFFRNPANDPSQGSQTVGNCRCLRGLPPASPGADSTSTERGRHRLFEA